MKKLYSKTIKTNENGKNYKYVILLIFNDRNLSKAVSRSVNSRYSE